MGKSDQLVLFSDIKKFANANQELIADILKDVHGNRANLNKYGHQELIDCVRYLIYKGYLRGTIIDHENCIWSKATKKGRYYYKLLLNLKK